MGFEPTMFLKCWFTKPVQSTVMRQEQNFILFIETQRERCCPANRVMGSSNSLLSVLPGLRLIHLVINHALYIVDIHPKFLSVSFREFFLVCPRVNPINVITIQMSFHTTTNRVRPVLLCFKSTWRESNPRL